MTHEQYIENLHKIKDLEEGRGYTLARDWELTRLLDECEHYEENLIRDAVKELNA
jgi:hypothetical protein